MILTTKNNNIVILAFITAFAIGGCGGGEESEDASGVKIDSAASAALQIGNVVFCIPSPIQTAVLIKNVGANYSKAMLNSTQNTVSYSTNYLKALNLGVYGADLGYATIYEQPQDGIKYLKAVQGLADDIGVSGAFSPEIMKRITDNLGSQDTLLNMVSDCYRSANAFLQNNDRDDACALILAGGWIESLYFVTQIAGSMANQQIINRIGEQKATLNNLIKLLEPHYNQPEFRELLDQLIDLAYGFDDVNVKYTFKQPTVDADKKTSTINSTSEVIITDEQIKNISEKIQLIRDQIIG